MVVDPTVLRHLYSSVNSSTEVETRLLRGETRLLKWRLVYGSRDSSTEGGRLVYGSEDSSTEVETRLRRG